MSRKPTKKKKAAPGHWRPISMGGGVFIPDGPPMIATKQGLRPLTSFEAARRYPGVAFGFPSESSASKRKQKRR